MKKRIRLHPVLALAAVAALAALCLPARAAEHITLRNGFGYDCLHHESAGDRVRLYLIPSAPTDQTGPEDSSYIEVAATNILRVETIPNPPTTLLSSRSSAKGSASPATTPADIHQLLAHAGAQHNIDTDLLASVVQAESAGNIRAVSRAGARGLMQLMPATAFTFGVHDSFAPDQNISGGTTYLDQLLTRYHDDLRLAVAAYNAGPAAVDRYHGIPPFAETRAYVTRVVREFNRRKLAAHATTMAAN